MEKDKIAIIGGRGYVGRAMNKIFTDALIFDVVNGDVSKEQVNESCRLAIVCVPTPMTDTADEFKKVDLSIIEDVIAWLDVPLILIKSTIPPGTTDYLIKKYNKKIAFSPEYVGEGKYQITPWKYMSPVDPTTHEFQIFGGEKETTEEIADIFTRYLGPEKFYYLIDAVEAEIIKYMENSWGALKVLFANEFWQLCKAFGVSYHRVREGWALDNRVERMHTSVFVNNQGFSGKCYPKDLNGIVCAADKVDVDLSLIKTILRKNLKLRGKDNQLDV